MSISKTLFAQTRLVPELGEDDWGPEVTDFLADLLDAANALASRDASLNVYARRIAATTAVTAGGTLTPTTSRHILSATSAITLSATNAIADGAVDGQELRLEGSSDVNTVTILDGANTDLNGLVTLEAGQTIDLYWHASDSVWRELTRSH